MWARVRADHERKVEEGDTKSCLIGEIESQGRKSSKSYVAKSSPRDGERSFFSKRIPIQSSRNDFRRSKRLHLIHAVVRRR